MKKKSWKYWGLLCVLLAMTGSLYFSNSSTMARSRRTAQEDTDEEETEEEETYEEMTYEEEPDSDGEEAQTKKEVDKNVSLGEYLKMPCTKKDSKAELSKVSFFVQGYRVSYLLEDGGEYYLPSEDYEVIVSEYNLLEKDPKKPFYNLDWKTTLKSGDVIGKIKWDPKEYVYTIARLSYQKISEIIPDWQTSLRYDKKTKTLYYGEDPANEESKLKKDEVYQLVTKAIKGKKSKEDKLKAIHDKIVLDCTYDLKKMSMHTSLRKKYSMSDNQSFVLHMVQDKKGICENYARLYQQCMRRLFIPCDCVFGEASNNAHLWNRVYLGDKSYHVDVTFDDPINNKYKKTSDVPHSYFLKSAYEFMGHHSWYGDDFAPEEFSKSWKKIDRKNITTTEELRRAAVYAAYLCRDGDKKTYEFVIKSNQVQISVLPYVMNYGFVRCGKGHYEKGVLSLTYNFTYDY